MLEGWGCLLCLVRLSISTAFKELGLFKEQSSEVVKVLRYYSEGCFTVHVLISSVRGLIQAFLSHNFDSYCTHQEDFVFSITFYTYPVTSCRSKAMWSSTSLLGNLINLFHVSCLFICTLKTSENHRFSDVFRGYRKEPVG